MPLIPALRRQRQLDLCEFEASLVYRVSSSTVKATQRNVVSKQTNKQTNKQVFGGLERWFSSVVKNIGCSFRRPGFNS